MDERDDDENESAVRALNSAMQKQAFALENFLDEAPAQPTLFPAPSDEFRPHLDSTSHSETSSSEAFSEQIAPYRQASLLDNQSTMENDDAEDGIRNELKQLRLSEILLRKEMERANSQPQTSLEQLSTTILDAADQVCSDEVTPSSASELRASVAHEKNKARGFTSGSNPCLDHVINVGDMDSSVGDGMIESMMGAVIDGCQGYANCDEIDPDPRPNKQGLEYMKPERRQSRRQSKRASKTSSPNLARSMSPTAKSREMNELPTHITTRRSFRKEKKGSDRKILSQPSDEVDIPPISIQEPQEEEVKPRSERRTSWKFLPKKVLYEQDMSGKTRNKSQGTSDVHAVVEMPEVLPLSVSEDTPKKRPSLMAMAKSLSTKLQSSNKKSAEEIEHKHEDDGAVVPASEQDVPKKVGNKRQGLADVQLVEDMPEVLPQLASEGPPQKRSSLMEMAKSLSTKLQSSNRKNTEQTITEQAEQKKKDVGSNAIAGTKSMDSSSCPPDGTSIEVSAFDADVEDGSPGEEGHEVEAFYQQKQQMTLRERIVSPEQHHEWKTQLFRKEWMGVKRIYWVFLILVVLMALLLGLIVLAFTGASASSSEEKPVNNAKVPLSDPRMELFPPYTQASFRNPQSPQSKAFTWLINDPSFEQYSGERRMQRFALAVLYFSTNGEGWIDADRVLQYDSDECQWFYSRAARVTPPACATAGGIIEALVLDSNNLEGTIPAELFLMTNLKVLSMADNQLASTIPSHGLDHMKNLQVLNLAQSGLSGPLPKTLGHLERLEELNLAKKPLDRVIAFGTQVSLQSGRASSSKEWLEWNSTWDCAC